MSEIELPIAEAAERGLLAALFFNSNLCDEVDLTPEELRVPSNRQIYRAIRALHDQGLAVDLESLVEQLVQYEKVKRIDAPVMVTNILDGQLRFQKNVETYVKQIREAKIRRRLIKLGARLLEVAQEGGVEGQEILAKAESAILNIADERFQTKFMRLGDVARERLAVITGIASGERPLTGTVTGYTDLDDLLSGLHNGQLIIVAARPAMGKSAFGLDIAEGVIRRSQGQLGVGFFSLEMGKESLVDRVLCKVARVDSQRVRKGLLSEANLYALRQASQLLDEWPLYLDETPGVTLAELRSRSRRLKRELERQGKRLGLIVVDYLQLMRGDGRDRRLEIEGNSRGLKELAKELDVPIIALAQVSRECERREDKRPILSDLREAGGIEQDADVVMFLYRDEIYNPLVPEVEGLAEIIVAKHREGPTGVIRMTFIKAFTRFENYVDPGRVLWQKTA